MWIVKRTSSTHQKLEVSAIMVTSKTNPSFDIWLFPEDAITTIIQTSGIYEPDETEFIEYVASKKGGGWAVDIGANVGFHSLHMAALGMNVIALEPSPDTARLLQRSIQQNGFRRRKGFVKIIQAAAADSPGLGRLVRLRGSAGMTILQRSGDDTALPFGIQDVIADEIPLVRPETSLADILPRNPNLQLLKIDAEGHELHAFRGVNLERFPFAFLSFEFFPELLWKAGHTDPLDLLIFIQSLGYVCTTNPSSLRKGENLLSTLEDVKQWYNNTAVPSHKRSPNFHLNFYCTISVT